MAWLEPEPSKRLKGLSEVSKGGLQFLGVCWALQGLRRCHCAARVACVLPSPPPPPPRRVPPGYLISAAAYKWKGERRQECGSALRDTLQPAFSEIPFPPWSHESVFFTICFFLPSHLPSAW